MLGWNVCALVLFLFSYAAFAPLPSTGFESAGIDGLCHLMVRHARTLNCWRREVSSRVSFEPGTCQTGGAANEPF